MSHPSEKFSDELLSHSLNALRNYIEDEKYRGYDPYDALNSPFFRLPVLKSNKLIRFGAQQFVKRFPINLRPLLLIKKGLNPVSLGLCIQGYTTMGIKGLLNESEVKKFCQPLISELETMIPDGFHGACWGYDFDWEARYARIPAYQPTIVATGFITNALYKYFRFTNDRKSIDLCRSACDFILTDINRTPGENDSFCFSYSPFDKNQVFNASMKGVRTLSQVYGITHEKHLAEAAANAARFVALYQQENGSWKYATQNKGEWIDNYHTGYVLDCFDEYRKNCNDRQYDDAIEKGFRYYREHFFENGCIPKFYDNAIFPIDCTSAAQSILTLIRFNDVSTAQKVAAFMIQKMQHPKGYFYFRAYKNFTEKHSFMRWSNSWMFAALPELIPGK